ncbi:MAG: hypothetical protein M3O71_26195 [Bacteroidota bacterium]|nr:hypothetical protein [Bacteroidota bacterium]
MPTDKKITELPIATSVNASDVSVLINGDTDYQYTFTLLLQFLQANLTTGAKISFGTILPQNTNGSNGDVFVNTSAGSFAQKISGTWTVVYTLPAASAADGTLLYGAGVPASGTGKNLDSYINTLTGIFYKKSAGAWSQVFSMATGPQGPQGTAGTNGTNGSDGNTILFGATNPSNTLTGVNGNFYINTSTYLLFGPKTAGTWGSGTSLLGAGTPAGGTTGQVLVKADGTDFNTDWQDNSFANLTGDPAANVNLSAALSAKQNALGFTPENTAAKNQANGYAGLDGSGKVAATQLPSYVDDVVEFANFAALPSPGETGKIYVTLDTNAEYRWSGSIYIQLVASPGSTDAVPEGSTNKYFTAARVLASILTGIGFSSATAITETDTILGALGKLQAQVTGLFKIPPGGTSGQILAKVDNADGNIHWVDSPSGGTGGAGYSDRPFDEILTFDANFKMTTSQIGNISFVLGSSPVDDVVARIIIIGDGLHACTFPNDWINAGGQLFDNQQKNVIYFEYDGTEVLYSIVKITIPDVVAPNIISTVIENTAKNKILLEYSELLDETSIPSTDAFAVNLSKAVTGITVLGSQVTVTVDSDYANGDVATISYTPGGNPIQDITGNDALSLSNEAITNNVNPARESVKITALSQVARSSVFPTAIDWSGTDGITQKPISFSFWIKRNNTDNARYLFSVAPNSDNPGFFCNFFTDGSFEFVFYGGHGHGGGGYLGQTTDTGVTANTWTHIVYTHDGSGTVAGTHVYFNASLQPLTTALESYTAVTSLDAATIISVFGDAGANSGSEMKNVQLSSFYAWMRELSSSDVNALYNSGQLIDPTTLSFANDLKVQYELNGNTLDSKSGYNLSSTASPVYIVDVP